MHSHSPFGHQGALADLPLLALVELARTDVPVRDFGQRPSFCHRVLLRHGRLRSRQSHNIPAKPIYCHLNRMRLAKKVCDFATRQELTGSLWVGGRRRASSRSSII